MELQMEPSLMHLHPVTYKDGTTEIISNPADFPDSIDYTSRIAMIEEPVGEWR